jgi:hypothetical protein
MKNGGGRYVNLPDTGVTPVGVEQKKTCLKSTASGLYFEKKHFLTPGGEGEKFPES